MRKSGFPEEKSIPFKHVYLHGLIRDIHGKNEQIQAGKPVIDPLDMIEKYGTDAVRLSLLIGSTPGTTCVFMKKKLLDTATLWNKIWNGARFVLMNLEEGATLDSANCSRADRWILSRLNEVTEGNRTLEAYRFSEASLMIYDFFGENIAIGIWKSARCTKIPPFCAPFLRQTSF